ncbi:NAD-dependent epimerase/dehydratase family protein, partial [Planktothrix agardhii]
MKHLITGGSGFLGNLIARRLYQRGEEVRILDIWED